MQSRLDFLNGLVPKGYTYYWEAKDGLYKTYKPIYPKLAMIEDISKIQGGWTKETPIIGDDEMSDQINYGIAEEGRPIEGTNVFYTIKTKSKKFAVPREVIRDMKHRAANWLKEQVSAVVPSMIETTKERIVHSIFNYGGYLLGHKIFDQRDSDSGCPTAVGQMPFDNVALFALSGNNHPSNHTTTYFNAYADTDTSETGQANGITLANAVKYYKLMVETNAKMENGAPFDNSMGINVLSSISGGLDWDIVLKSEKNPDNGNNAKNPMIGNIEGIIASPYVLTTTQSVLFRKEGIKVYFGKPQFEFYEKKDPDVTYFKVLLDYAINARTYKTFVANNAPTAA